MTELTAHQPVTILRKADVQKRTGLAYSTLWDQMDKELFTKPVMLTPNTVGWPDYEVQLQITARLMGKSDDELRQLVQDLLKARDTLPLLSYDEAMAAGAKMLGVNRLSLDGQKLQFPDQPLLAEKALR